MSRRDCPSKSPPLHGDQAARTGERVCWDKRHTNDAVLDATSSGIAHNGAVLEPLGLVLLVAAGLLAGVINTVSGGGSFLTLPLLIFLGLPAIEANGTNRVGVLMQSLAAVAGFQHAASIHWRWTLQVTAPALAGAALGAVGAFYVSDEAFERVLATFMVLITLVSIRGTRARPRREARSARSPMVLGAFFLVGLYVGFIQAGVGFLILALTSWAGHDLVRGNAVKVVSVGLLSVLTVALFVARDTVNWPMGLALGTGNMVGALLGVRLAVLKGHGWLKGVVTATVLLFAVILWLE